MHLKIPCSVKITS